MSIAIIILAVCTVLGIIIAPSGFVDWQEVDEAIADIEREAERIEREAERIEREAERIERRDREPDTIVDPDEIGIGRREAKWMADSPFSYWFDDGRMVEPMCELGRGIHAVSREANRRMPEDEVDAVIDRWFGGDR